MRYAPVIAPAAALAASLVRWKLQDSGNVYTALSKRFFVPDPDLTWKVSDHHPIWIGLELCGILLAWTIGVAVGCWLVGRQERKHKRAPILKPLVWVVAVLALAIPIAAFASGGRPDGAVDLRPVGEAKQVAAGLDGKLAAPAGRYEVVAHEGSAIVARVSAGGEAFDARFAGGIEGAWQGDPADFTKPTTASISVATSSIDTGIDQRSNHARDGYLLAGQHPRIAFTLGKVTAAKNTSPDKIDFAADGTIALAGKTHAVQVTGSLTALDAAALGRMKLEAGTYLRAEADLSIAIAESAFAADKKDFDGDRIPIHVSLVMRHTSGSSETTGARENTP